jgi:membrane protein insertase Oxa1/YidC/SpoIIIJ
MTWADILVVSSLLAFVVIVVGVAIAIGIYWTVTNLEDKD